MRAMEIRERNGEFVLVDREIPEPPPGWVRIKVQACGVCHSDAFVKFGAFPGLAFPRSPGHEVAGVVDKIGEDVDQFEPGQRVGVGWHGGHCFRCQPCRRGQFINCVKEKICGIHYDGGYQEFMIAPSEAIARLPDELNPIEAGPLLCAGITTFNALRNAGVRPGDCVAVQGVGGLGHLGIQFANRMGMRTVALSRGADKAKLASELGAHHYIDAANSDTVEELQKLGGADVILATAPNAEAISGVIGGLKPRGKMVLVAAVPDKLEIPALAMLSGKELRGWPSGTAIDSEDTLNFSALTGVRPMTETFALEQANEAFVKMMSNEVRFRAVLTMS